MPGDWILGNSSKLKGNLLIYAMRISEVLPFSVYYNDPRFAYKKASPSDWRSRCGDNICFQDDSGTWVQGVAFYHTEPYRVVSDTRYPRVFVSNHFFYFGENAPAVPAQFGSLLQTRQGCRCKRQAALVKSFVEWIENTYRPGRYGLPRDNSEKPVAAVNLVKLGGIGSRGPRRA